MKLIARIFVLSLVATGAVASSHVASAAQKSGDVVITAKTSALPVPMCPPDDPNFCGMGSKGN